MDTKYLQKRGHRWSVRITVPRTLQHLLGTHLRKALRTSDLKIANRRKLKVLASLKDQIVVARQESIAPNIKSAAASLRESLREAHAQDDTNTSEAISFLATDKAEEIKQEHGLKAAKTFHDEAPSLTLTLSKVTDEWLTSTEIKESTRFKRRKAYEGLHNFLGGDTLPHKLTDVQARDYVDLLKCSDLSPNTIRDKLSALGGLWQYMFERLIIPKGANPWKRFTIKGGSTESCRAFTKEEILAILSTKFPQSWHKDIFICLLLTGARPKEICGLRHSDVNLAGKRISISSSKTKVGERDLPVEHPVLLSALKKYTKNNKSGFIFPVTCGGADKSPAANYTKMFGRIKKVLGFPPEVQLYSARKSFTSTALDLELSPAEIERYVGHEVGRLIYTVYSRGRGEKGLREVAKGFRYDKAIERKLVTLLELNP